MLIGYAADALLQVMKAAAAHRADGAEDIAAGCQAVAEMLGRVVDALETRFGTILEEPNSDR
ncbi:hypothetical protein H0E84_15130 [Luteimonas sp. SJ-92]|uniref:Uncharacterized protein n=1 Tax=Luteimonas salinisoli TaxID=2752307 RepID=A0A853JEF9_9GAMM|nr:hypothetical protein [Luteimonas salinisoli]NZA27713.1 hypothetical protein [Luteimonas salinisoli]